MAKSAPVPDGSGLPTCRRPSLGTTVLLVYCECPCGRWLGNMEGGYLPRCSECGGVFVPGGGPLEKASEGSVLSGAASRRARDGLGFVATLGREMQSVSDIRKIRAGMDPDDGWTKAPHYSMEDRQGRSDQIVSHDHSLED
jgi:hypothetical protein